MSKWDLIKLKSFCTAKETVNKMRKKKIPVKYEKRFANNAVDKRLITKVHKQLIQLNFRKQTNKKTESKNKQKA